MLPGIIFETLATDSILNSNGIDSSRIFELQSVDERPVDIGYFIIMNWQESTSYTQSMGLGQSSINKAPRVLTFWVHTPMDRTRDYAIIDRVLNRIDDLLLPIEQQAGTDNIRVTCITKQGRSANLIDDGWKTIARNATYGVLYDETSV